MLYINETVWRVPQGKGQQKKYLVPFLRTIFRGVNIQQKFNFICVILYFDSEKKRYKGNLL